VLRSAYLVVWQQTRSFGGNPELARSLLRARPGVFSRNAIAGERPAPTALFPLPRSVLTEELLTLYPCTAGESNCGWKHKIRRQVEFPQHPWRRPDENSTCSQFVSHARSPDPWDQPIANTCRIFVVAWEFFSEGSLLDLNTNREHSKQDTSPEKPPPGT
jgi:hypothetical protein